VFSVLVNKFGLKIGSSEKIRTRDTAL